MKFEYALYTRNKHTARLKEMCDAMGGLLQPMPTSSLDGRGIKGLQELIIKEILEDDASNNWAELTED